MFIVLLLYYCIIIVLFFTEAGRSPKASVGANAAGEARKEEGVGGGGAGPAGA